MKHAQLFVLLLLWSCSEILEPEIIETERIAIIEIFGYSLCPNCPFADHAADSLYIEFEDKLCVLEYHYPQFGDTLSPQSETSNRAEWYNITGFPTAYINGRIRKEGASANVINEYRNFILSELSKAPPVKFELENRLTGLSLSGTLSVALNFIDANGIDFQNTRLFSILNEDSIFFKQTGAPDSIYNHTVRKFIPEGDSGVSISPGETMIQLPYSLKPSWNREKMEAVIFLQNMQSKEVYQASCLRFDSIISVPYSFYVEAPDTIQYVNPTEEAVFNFELYNTGTENDYYNLEVMGVGFPKSWNVQFCYGNVCLISGLPYNVIDTISAGECDTAIAIHAFTDTLKTTGVVDFTIIPQSDTTLVEKYRLYVVTSKMISKYGFYKNKK